MSILTTFPAARVPSDAEVRAQTAQTVSRLFLRSQSKTTNNTNGL